MVEKMTNEDKDKFVNSLIKANFNYKNTLWLESYFRMNLDNSKNKQNLYLYCKFITENNESRIFFSFIDSYFELSIRKKKDGKTYKITIDEKLIDECFKLFINKYINIRTLSQKEYCDVFCDVLYFALNNSSEIFCEDFCIPMEGDEWYLEINC